MVITFKWSGRKCFFDRIELPKIEYISKATIYQSDPGLRTLSGCTLFEDFQKTSRTYCFIDRKTKADTFTRKSCLILPAWEAISKAGLSTHVKWKMFSFWRYLPVSVLSGLI